MKKILVGAFLSLLVLFSNQVLAQVTVSGSQTQVVLANLAAPYVVGDVVVAGTTTTLALVNDIATGNVLLSGGVGTVPLFGKVGLTTHVSGVLPTANGGTGMAYFTVAGPLAARIFTFPNAAATVFTDYAAPTPATAAAIDLGTALLPFKELYIAGTSGTPGTNNFRITGASTTGTRVITLPDAALNLSTTTQNYVLATGAAGAGAASLRALVALDIPSLDAAKIGSGVLPVAYGGTGLTTATYGAATPASSTGFGTGVAGVVQAGSTDFGGRVTIGAGDDTTGAVTFGGTYTVAPHCVANNESKVQAVYASASTTILTLTGVFVATDKITWVCR